MNLWLSNTSENKWSWKKRRKQMENKTNEHISFSIVLDLPLYEYEEEKSHSTFIRRTIRCVFFCCVFFILVYSFHTISQYECDVSVLCRRVAFLFCQKFLFILSKINSISNVHQHAISRKVIVLIWTCFIKI